jgi:hypothetical protein
MHEEERADEVVRAAQQIRDVLWDGQAPPYGG